MWVKKKFVYSLFFFLLEKPKQKRRKNQDFLKKKTQKIGYKTCKKDTRDFLLYVSIRSFLTNIFSPFYLVMLFQEYQNVFSPNIQKAVLHGAVKLHGRKLFVIWAKQEQETLYKRQVIDPTSSNMSWKWLFVKKIHVFITFFNRELRTASYSYLRCK